MAVTNFIQQIWSKSILDSLEVACKLVQNCHREYEGDCKYAGSVKILGVGEPTVGNYVTGQDIVIEDLSDEGQVLNIDQRKYFAFYVDDVDKAQSVPGLPEKYQEKSVHALKVARDTFVASLIKVANYVPTKDTTAVSGKSYYTKTNETTYASVTPASGANPANLGYYEAASAHVTTATAKTEDAVAKAIDDAIVALRERNFDEEGVIEITPAVYNLFKHKLITLSTNNPEYIKKGIVGMYDDFEVIMSNNLAKDANHAYCAARGKKAIAFAGQLEKVEACRAEKRFADIVKGLDVYGGKVIDNDRIQVIKVPV